MRINYNCIRDILFFIEVNQILDDNLSSNEICLDDLVNSESLSPYGRGEIAYSIIILNEAGYIDCVLHGADGYFLIGATIYRLTYSGHLFLDSIRPASVWKTINSKLKAIGTASLPLIQQTANSLILDMIK